MLDHRVKDLLCRLKTSAKAVLGLDISYTVKCCKKYLWQDIRYPAFKIVELVHVHTGIQKPEVEHFSRHHKCLHAVSYRTLQVELIKVEDDMLRYKQEWC